MDDSKPNKKITVCIVGGGNSAHVLIPFLSEAGHEVNLMTRRPKEWGNSVRCDITSMDNTVSKTFIGKFKRSSEPNDVIPDADAIILCMPVHSQRNALGRLAPYISRSKKEVFVGTIYGQAGFNWMVHEIENENKLDNVTCFAVGLIPWICRTLKYGKHVANYGGKQVNICAVTPGHKFHKLNVLLLNDFSWNPMGVGKFVQACSFLSLTLSVDNQIIHPSRCFGIAKVNPSMTWSTIDEVPYFYRDFDDISAEVLTNIDNDYSTIRAAVRKHFPERPFPYMLSYFDLEKLTHCSKHVDIRASFKDSSQLGQIKTPIVELKDGSQKLDINCRFFTDDISYGLLLAKWVAEKLNVDTPHIDHIIIWAQQLRGEHWLKEDSKEIDMEFCLREKQRTGLPPSYGIKSIDDILD